MEFGWRSRGYSTEAPLPYFSGFDPSSAWCLSRICSWLGCTSLPDSLAGDCFSGGRRKLSRFFSPGNKESSAAGNRSLFQERNRISIYRGVPRIAAECRIQGLGSESQSGTHPGVSQSAHAFHFGKRLFPEFVVRREKSKQKLGIVSRSNTFKPLQTAPTSTATTSNSYSLLFIHNSST